MIFIENKGTLHTSVFQKKKNNRQKECQRVPWSSLMIDLPQNHTFVQFESP